MRLLLTAGPTREAIDPVRFLTNRSSGKMGYAIAEAAVGRGHEVILVSGPVNLEPPSGLVDFASVESAREMFEAVRDRIGECDAAIFCAAVADYRPVKIHEEKIKKSDDSLTLELEKTEDILGSARSIFGFHGVLVGFAAETHNLEEFAWAKLEKKGCDLLVANDVSRRDIGFDSDENEVRLFFHNGRRKTMPANSKAAIGEKLVEIIEALVKGAGADASPSDLFADR
ncbi:MAG: phosphopantothenoylcysteine decarboxylase [Verrucomicrobiae bacterium]|nr:phosphopantothenoylcysteine decarboxylase [Verrucomicrobiae bacterium]